jgi:hypothetical protein
LSWRGASRGSQKKPKESKKPFKGEVLVAEYHYAAFGMDITSDFLLMLPEALTHPQAQNYAVTGWQVEIRNRPVPQETDYPFLLPHSTRVQYKVEGSRVAGEIADVCRFSVNDATSVDIDPDPDCIQARLASWIRSFILIILVNHRDLVTLHGSAVAIPRGKDSVDDFAGGLIFLGDRESGKSTTAAALGTRGFSVIADDVILVDGHAMIQPGLPHPNLLPDAYEFLIGDTAKASHLFNGLDKYFAQLPLCTTPVGLKAVFIIEIEPSASAEFRIEPVTGAKKIPLILGHSIMIEGIDEPVSFYGRLSERLADVVLFRITRPRSVNTIDEIATSIIQIMNKE